ncbi:hypothetical protein DPMN_044030 [Dreissena polymorpha]|uniref:Uncharacterized protein n=1 Tax=Dreissena polymorpha TaxID=45954 RepID=A0A9D4HYI8_DREPO|nr:hypothetical protein DPMN_044030 [Dreissena polymorpha]
MKETHWKTMRISGISTDKHEQTTLENHENIRNQYRVVRMKEPLWKTMRISGISTEQKEPGISTEESVLSILRIKPGISTEKEPGISTEESVLSILRIVSRKEQQLKTMRYWYDMVEDTTIKG